MGRKTLLPAGLRCIGSDVMGAITIQTWAARFTAGPSADIILSVSMRAFMPAFDTAKQRHRRALSVC